MIIDFVLAQNQLNKMNNMSVTSYSKFIRLSVTLFQDVGKVRYQNFKIDNFNVKRLLIL